MNKFNVKCTFKIYNPCADRLHMIIRKQAPMSSKLRSRNRSGWFLWGLWSSSPVSVSVSPQSQPRFWFVCNGERIHRPNCLLCFAWSANVGLSTCSFPHDSPVEASALPGRFCWSTKRVFSWNALSPEVVWGIHHSPAEHLQSGRDSVWLIIRLLRFNGVPSPQDSFIGDRNRNPNEVR